MSVDAQRLQAFPHITTVLVDVPLLTIITVALVWQFLGVASLAILVVLALIVPLNGVWIAKLISNLQVPVIKLYKLEFQLLEYFIILKKSFKAIFYFCSENKCRRKTSVSKQSTKFCLE